MESHLILRAVGTAALWGQTRNVAAPSLDFLFTPDFATPFSFCRYEWKLEGKNLWSKALGMAYDFHVCGGGTGLE